MTRYVALLRAVNVGGTGKLPMSTLSALCEACGFSGVRTYIASGNVVFDSDLAEADVKTALEGALQAYAGKPVGVLVRSGAELAGVLAARPFPTASPDRTHVVFLDAAPPEDWAAGITGRDSESVLAGVRELYIHYPDGQGRSKLRIPAARSGTARSMNTVAKLADLTAR